MRHTFRRGKKGPGGPFFWVSMGLFVALLTVTGALLAGRFFLTVTQLVERQGTVHHAVPLAPKGAAKLVERVPEELPVVGPVVAHTGPTETQEKDTGPAEPVGVVPAVMHPVVPVPALWRWKAHMRPVEVPAGAAKLAILLDDMGDIDSETRVLKATSVEAVDKMPAAVTLSFFPWYADGIKLAHTAYGKGHEIWVHMPMEPLKHGDAVFDPGMNALTVGMTPASLRGLIAVNMAPLADMAVGFNNHMGSKFTKSAAGMRVVLEEAQRQGYAFVDSRTAGHTATADAAKGLVLPILVRDVFLDDKPGQDEVKTQLAKAVAQAKAQGHALVIGHPLPDTLAVLEEALPRLKDEGIVLVPVSALIR